VLTQKRTSLYAITLTSSSQIHKKPTVSHPNRTRFTFPCTSPSSNHYNASTSIYENRCPSNRLWLCRPYDCPLAHLLPHTFHPPRGPLWPFGDRSSGRRSGLVILVQSTPYCTNESKANYVNSTLQCAPLRYTSLSVYHKRC
jgi:hypothetical protein